MDLNNYLKILKTKKQTIFVFVIMACVISGLITFLQPLKYSGKEKLLIVQNMPASGDPYSFSKSNEFYSGILAEVINSKSFFDKVMESGYQIDKSYFLGDNREQMKKWNKTVNAKPIYDSGIIEIGVYHSDKMQIEQIAGAINLIMKYNHQDYHGAGDKVAVKVIDEPIISRFPVKPNIVQNFSVALLFGLIIGLSYVYLFPGKEYDIRIINREKKTIKNKQIEYSAPAEINHHFAHDYSNNEANKVKADQKNDQKDNSANFDKIFPTDGINNLF